VRKRSDSSRCAVCGARCRSSHPVELCYWAQGIWVWCSAKLCRPCTMSVRDLFRWPARP
jgi:hypothetical protein